MPASTPSRSDVNVAGVKTRLRKPSRDSQALPNAPFAAAAKARCARARVGELRGEQGASDDAILEALVAAEEAKNRARELSEQAREEYGTAPPSQQERRENKPK